MPIFSKVAQVLSIACFAWYGLYSLVSKNARAEFEHYRLPHLRVLTGTLQLAGALGLIVGRFFRPLLLASAAGLALMMALAVLTRIRIRDPWYKALPSLTLCLVNAFIVVAAI